MRWFITPLILGLISGMAGFLPMSLFTGLELALYCAGIPFALAVFFLEYLSFSKPLCFNKTFCLWFVITLLIIGTGWVAAYWAALHIVKLLINAEASLLLISAVTGIAGGLIGGGSVLLSIIACSLSYRQKKIVPILIATSCISGILTTYLFFISIDAFGLPLYLFTLWQISVLLSLAFYLKRYVHQTSSPTKAGAA